MPGGGNSVAADGEIDAGDALAIINYINSFQSGPIPKNAVLGLPFGFLDTDRDNSVTAGDALRVINAINAAEGEGESGPMVPIGQALPDRPPLGDTLDSLLTLLALDTAAQSPHRRRA
jgi:Dockerin type I domain